MFDELWEAFEILAGPAVTNFHPTVVAAESAEEIFSKLNLSRCGSPNRCRHTRWHGWKRANISARDERQNRIDAAIDQVGDVEEVEGLCDPIHTGVLS